MPFSTAPWPPMSDQQATNTASWRVNASGSLRTEPQQRDQGYRALFDSSEPDVNHRQTLYYSSPTDQSTPAMYTQCQPTYASQYSSLPRPAAVNGNGMLPPTGPASQRHQTQAQTQGQARPGMQLGANSRNMHPIPFGRTPSPNRLPIPRAQTFHQPRSTNTAPALNLAMFTTPNTSRIEASDRPGVVNGYAATQSQTQTHDDALAHAFGGVDLSSSRHIRGGFSNEQLDRPFQSRTIGRSAPHGFDGTPFPALFNNAPNPSVYTQFSNGGSLRGQTPNAEPLPYMPGSMQVQPQNIPSSNPFGMPSSWAQHSQPTQRPAYNDQSTAPYFQTFQYHNTPSELGQPLPSPLGASSQDFRASNVLTSRRAPSDVQQPQQHLPIRSAKLQDFRDKSKHTLRWELKDVFDHIVEFSGDHAGSMFIQQKLKEAKKEDKDMVFKELQQEAVPLMKDIFGNYVVQRFFELGDQEQKRILVREMRGRVVELAKDTYGCRVIQKALDLVISDDQRLMLTELKRSVMDLVKNENGNHVIQACIKDCRATDLDCITDQFFEHVRFLSTHRYGCRIIQRMLEHCESVVVERLMQELRVCIEELITDQYGNYVPQHIVNNDAKERGHILGIVLRNLVFYAKQKYASNVVEKCISAGTPSEQRQIYRQLIQQDRIQHGELLPFLIRDGYGNYVIQSLLRHLRTRENDFEEFLACVAPAHAKAESAGKCKQTDNVGHAMERCPQTNGWDAPKKSKEAYFGSFGSGSLGGIRGSMHAPAQINTHVPPTRPTAAPTPPLTVGGSESPQSISEMPRNDSGRATLTPDSPRREFAF